MKKIKLTKNDILHLINLSKLKLTAEELEKYKKQLEDTVDYINNLKELSTEQVMPTSHTNNLSNVFFDDGEENEIALTQDEALANGMNIKDGYFVIKRIMQ